MFIYSLLPSWEQRKDFAHLKIIIIYYYIGNTVHWILLEKKKNYAPEFPSPTLNPSQYTQ